ncbi:hypothetical protein D8S93_23940 [Vibrio sp. VGrn 2]|uniref:LPO_1073/Vpar_1526 family protein n=1 Tax=Vibrio sp. VGrn 2 TaxID=2419839 RepID=UPI00128B3160|nr:LPO_1073/Vpar_1526 family protein [Vibrio sp. VGrn 2]MPS41627.1 hypothetical protein [Vibrio sp. VGrn 2]
MLGDKQEQIVKEKAIAVQTKGDVHIEQNIGVSYSDVKDIANDLFERNFLELSELAANIATKRAREVTNKAISKLKKEFGEEFVKASDPNFQSCLYDIQVEYAKTGDDELGDLLIDALVQVCSEDARSLKGIVFKESLKVIPKLTKTHVVTLSIIFFLRSCTQAGIRNYAMLGNFLDEFVKPLLTEISTHPSCYQHLEFSGCVTFDNNQPSLASSFKNVFPELFQRGFDESIVEGLGLSNELRQEFISTCLTDKSKYSVWFLPEDGLDKKLNRLNIPLETQKKVVSAYISHRMSDVEIIKHCIEVRPYMEKLFSVWTSRGINNLRLTTVGIAIGSQYFEKISKTKTDLSGWFE